jgi:hypothetical protein
MNNPYTQQLETLIINKLLPAYVEHCKYFGNPVDFSDVPQHVLTQTAYAKNVAALLRPKNSA